MVHSGSQLPRTVFAFALAVTSLAAAVSAKAQAPGAYSVVTAFGVAHPDGALATAVIPGADGALYGATTRGGADGMGLIYRIQPDGSGFTNLISFLDLPGQPQKPSGPLIQLADGALVGGYTDLAGRAGLYHVRPDGARLARLTDLPTTNGLALNALCQGADGLVYAVFGTGGPATAGTLVSYTTNGMASLVHAFPSGPGDGAVPRALVSTPDGTIWGLTTQGGTNNAGLLFRYQPGGGGYTVVHHFSSTAEGSPENLLTADPAGVVYGVLRYGGTNGAGLVFAARADGTYTTPARFPAAPSSVARPMGALVAPGDGSVYGLDEPTLLGAYGTAIFQASAASPTPATLFSFPGGTNAASAFSLISAGPGVLAGLGLTADGSEAILFRLQTDGSGYLELKRFPVPGPAPARPFGPLAQTADGALFGATQAGGASWSGTLYGLWPGAASVHTLYSFTGIPFGDLRAPYPPNGVALQDGSTLEAVLRMPHGLAPFQISTNGTFPYVGAQLLSPGETSPLSSSFATCATGGAAGEGVLLQDDGLSIWPVSEHEFGASAGDGATPSGTLAAFGANRFYGATLAGGAFGAGTIYEFGFAKVVAPPYTKFFYTNLFSFPTNGPWAGLTPVGLSAGLDGAVYGASSTGGAGNAGAVFQIQPDGSGFRLLYSFTGGTDGAIPSAPVLQGFDGRLYGTTTEGGAGHGTLFSVSPDGGGFSLIHTFGGTNEDGHLPQAPLIAGVDGAFYGSTLVGGPGGDGTLFRLMPYTHLTPTFVTTTQTIWAGMGWTNTVPPPFFVNPTPGEAYAVTVSDLPPGITFNPATGVFSGTPTAIGSFTVVLTANYTNALGLPPVSATAFNLKIQPFADLTIFRPSTNSRVVIGAGKPGAAYVLQVSTNPATGPWRSYPALTADALGMFSNVSYINPTVTRQFYRAISP